MSCSQHHQHLDSFMKSLRFLPFLLAMTTGIVSLSAAPLVTLETVAVGDPNNNADPVSDVGQVTNSYRIGKYDITVSQYLSFLNAVATKPATITNPKVSAAIANLWIPAMSSTKAKSYVTTTGMIQRTGAGTAQSPYLYSEQIDTTWNSQFGTNASERRPMFEISWFRAARFANWMHNGATNGASTETGAYTLNGATTGVIVKNPGAKWWIPTESEWYKAAYYDPTLSTTNVANGVTNVTAGGYHDFSTKADGTNFPVPEAPPGGTNSANYSGITGDGLKLTPVGSYSNSTSYYGCYDMAGPLWQWNDQIYTNGSGVGETRGMRGGSWSLGIYTIHRNSPRDYPPNYDDDDAGFRLCTTNSVP